MGGMKTSAVILGVVATGVCATPATSDLSRDFAGCVGRYSAMLEHAWLMQAPEAEEYERLRGAFLSLLDAVGNTSSPDALNHRIEAKVAQATLLQQASFGTDAARSEWAQERSEEFLASCRYLLLDG